MRSPNPGKNVYDNCKILFHMKRFLSKMKRKPGDGGNVGTKQCSADGGRMTCNCLSLGKIFEWNRQWKLQNTNISTHTHKHTRLTSFFTELPGSAGTRKVKPIWILLKQEAVSGSGITWTICKSAPRSRQITTPTPHHSVFYRPNPFLPPNQQRQSTEGNQSVTNIRPKVSELTNTKHLQCQACDKYNIIGKVT